MAKRRYTKTEMQEIINELDGLRDGKSDALGTVLNSAARALRQAQDDMGPLEGNERMPRGASVVREALSNLVHAKTVSTLHNLGPKVIERIDKSPGMWTQVKKLAEQYAERLLLLIGRLDR